MYEIVKERIKNTNYKLEEMLDKIYTLYAKDELTKEEMEELETLARTNANAENSYVPLQKQINNIYTIIDKIQADIKELKGEEEPIEPIEEYPEFVQPTGAHDAYNKGRKITYKGEKYICLIDGCVWAPDVYPQGWKKVEESEN